MYCGDFDYQQRSTGLEPDTPPPPSWADRGWTATAAETEFIRVLEQASRLETQSSCSMKNTAYTASGPLHVWDIWKEDSVWCPRRVWDTKLKERKEEFTRPCLFSSPLHRTHTQLLGKREAWQTGSEVQEFCQTGPARKAWHWPERRPFRNLYPLNMHQFAVLMKNRLGVWEKERGLQAYRQNQRRK